MPLYIVEARTPGGQLVKDPDKQPPFGQASRNQIEDYYVDNAKQTERGGVLRWRMITDWYESKGWFIRERTW